MKINWHVPLAVVAVVVIDIVQTILYFLQLLLQHASFRQNNFLCALQ